MEIPDQLYRILTRRGFVEEFWRELRRRRKEDPSVSGRQVFEQLEGMYEREFNEELFCSYGAFHKWLHRLLIKKIT